MPLCTTLIRLDSRELHSMCGTKTLKALHYFGERLFQIVYFLRTIPKILGNSIYSGWPLPFPFRVFQFTVEIVTIMTTTCSRAILTANDDDDDVCLRVVLAPLHIFTFNPFNMLFNWFTVLPTHYPQPHTYTHS